MTQEYTSSNFLKLVAEDLFNSYGDTLSDILIIFPNNRARLFFNEEIFRAGGGKPLWSPSYTTITELFRDESVLRIADPLKLIHELHQVYNKETGLQETLDDFYYWGEILLGDFDDVDKNLADARQLFTNIDEWNSFGNATDHLEEEQLEVLKRFFQHFDPDKRTELKERFAGIWNRLYPIYLHFRNSLRSQGLAYEGMMYRDAYEKMKEKGGAMLPYKKYVFIGFNALSNVETQVFKLLQQADKALFYWDYDFFYLESQRHEAGSFLNRNLKMFPNRLPGAYFHSFKQITKEITYISSATENAQARYLPAWIEELKQQNAFTPSGSAVVLCNEGLLLPILHALPDSVEDINVTMGFPFVQTPVYDLIQLLIALQTDGYMEERRRYKLSFVSPLLRQTYINRLSQEADALEKELTQKSIFSPTPSWLQRDEILMKVFTPVDSITALCSYILDILTSLSAYYAENEETATSYDDLYKEALFRGYTAINRMQSLIESEKIDFKPSTFRKLLQRVLSVLTIPFNGEPVRGMQIMGVLETRNLDFENVLLLSVNEGLMPKIKKDSSFIPYFLRKSFGLTTLEQKDAIYAYYFYRMIQRAKRITCIYNTSSEGLNKGEKSRYLLQLLAEADIPVRQLEIRSDVSPLHPKVINIRKSPEIVEHLKEKYVSNIERTSYLSPSALNTYMDCPLKFYFRYIAGLSEEKERTEEIDNAMFGTIFHKSVQLLYEDIKLRKEFIQSSDLDFYLKERHLTEKYIDRAFNTEFFQQDENAKPDYDGTQLINRKVLTDYIQLLLKIDKVHTPFSIVDMERKVYDLFEIEINGEKLPVRIGGYIDRIDRIENRIRVLDYKTGGTPDIVPDIESLFVSSDRRSGYIFQTLLYCIILKRKGVKEAISPAILYIHKAGTGDYSSAIQIRTFGEITDVSELQEEFSLYLDRLLKEIFDPEINFSQTEQVKKCVYCDFRKICKRE